MLLVMRAWREEVARSAGRGGGRGVGAEARRARNLGAPSQNSASFVSFRQTFGKRRSICQKNAFPVFSTSVEATQAFWHIRAVTNYMRLTHTAHIAHKRARTARAAVQEYAKEEVKRASEETTRLAEQRERELERQARGERTQGPAARTRMDARIDSTTVRVRGTPERQGIRKVTRRGPTHVCAKIGKIIVALMEYRRPRFGDG
jgi:hypothetical protein